MLERGIVKKFPGFLSELQQQLERLPQASLLRITRYGGLDLHDLIALILEPRDFTVDRPDEVPQDEIFHYSELKSSESGQSLVQNNEVAFCILAGGAGTRIGGPKCLLSLGNGETLLSKKIRQVGDLKNIWVIISPDLKERVVDHLTERSLMSNHIKIVEQFESFRLTPNNQLFLLNNEVSLYPCGHGDVIPALVQSEVLQKFNENGGKHVYVVNVDNISANIDPDILGLHHANNTPVTCEVVARNSSDSGGFLCNHMGIPQIVEGFRMSYDTDQAKFTHINTNTMIFQSNLDFNSIIWSWHRVKKNYNGNLVIQYERLLQQLTCHFKTQFVEVERARRFTPIKNVSDLDRVKNDSR